MTYDPSLDLAACFADFGVSIKWTDESTGTLRTTMGHFYAPGKDANLGGITVCAVEPYIDFATVALPNLGADHVVQIALMPAQLAMYNASAGTQLTGPIVEFKVRNTTPQAGGYITRATLKRA